MKTICLLLLYCLKASHWSSVIGQWRSQLNQTLSAVVILLSSNVNSKQCRKFKTIISLFILAFTAPAFLHAQQTITGTVLSNTGAPVVNAGITARHSKTTAVTNANGVFSIIIKNFPDTFLVVHIGYAPQQFIVNNGSAGNIFITLYETANELDETIVIAYGKTTRRYNTGNIAKLAAKDIGSQPVVNPLSAMAGRMSGVTVSPSSGVGGSTINIQVRGRGSLLQGSEPLYVIDGVPFAAGNQPVSKLGSAMTSVVGTGMSPFASINPADIESIEVLKDADATAIYGSRGANGVILITTKKALAGKTKLNIDVYRSTSSLTRIMPMLNTAQYVQLRKDAFAADGITPTATNAPDLLVWDTNRYTNIQDMMYRQYAPALNINATLGGGDANTQYSVYAGYRNEQTLFSNSMGLTRANAGIRLHHNTTDRKFSIDASAGYSHTRNNITADAIGHSTLPPNVPALFDSAGNLKWEGNGIAFTNPFTYRHRKYTAKVANLLGSVDLGYRLTNGLRVSLSLGYSALRNDETSLFPLSSLDPAWMATGQLELAGSHFQNWIAEPQLHYDTRLMGGTLKLLAGGSLQSNMITGHQITASGYSSDLLLNSLAAAPTILIKRNNESRYRYSGVFARVNYIHSGKYLLNVSARNDGSSRFGKGKQFSTFAAASAGWIFSNEQLFKQHLRFLSYGKLRGSYGSSGNDQVGDYGYLDSWTAAQPYAGNATLYPTNIANTDYRWEVNRKLEAALELGFLQDRILLTTAWFRNRSSNQLVNFRLPAQAGFAALLRNLDATVQNTGVEIELATKNINNKHLQWQTSFNITLPRNRLIRFPGLALSPYSNTYVVGQPLSVIYRYRYTGVDPQSGVFGFEDLDKSGTLTTADYQVNGNTDPEFYGGLQNSVSYKGLQLDVFIDFKKQRGRNYLWSLYGTYNVPGMMNNLPQLALNYWQNPGDLVPLQRLTTNAASAAYKAGTATLMNSDGIYTDASFARLRNISLSYTLPSKWLNKAGIRMLQLYVQAHNIAVLTKYEGADPEVQNLFQQPLLKTFATGLRVEL